jgi:hypothetical protein
MTCPQCSYDNKDGVSSCEECGFPFPTESDANLKDLLAQIDEELGLDDDYYEEEEEELDLVLPQDGTLLPLRLGSLAQLKELVQGVIDKTIPEEDLLETIDDFQEEINDNLDSLDQMVVSPQVQEVMKKPIQAARLAFEHYDQTFAEFRQYFVDKDIEHLKSALQMEEIANSYLSLSFNLVRETMTNMLGF